MYAQIGNIVFQNLKGFTDLSRSGSAVLAEHQVLSGKPKLQRTGTALEEISISMRLHASFCNPDAELSAIKQYREDSEVLPFLYGNGRLIGNYVIISVDDTVEDADAQGNVFSYIVNISLREYVMPDRVQQQQQEARSNATAVGDKKPVSNRKTNPSPCANIITGIVTKIENHSARINTVVVDRGGLLTPDNRYSILHDLSAARLLVEDLLKRCDDPASCAHGDEPLKYRAQQVFLAINNFNASVSNKLSANVSGDNQVLQAVVRNLKIVSQSFVKKSILRQ